MVVCKESPHNKKTNLQGEDCNKQQFTLANHRINKYIYIIIIPLLMWQPFNKSKTTKKKLQNFQKIGVFLKWWYPTTMGFPTKNDHFGVWNGGYHYLRKHPNSYSSQGAAKFIPSWFPSIKTHQPIDIDTFRNGDAAEDQRGLGASHKGKDGAWCHHGPGRIIKQITPSTCPWEILVVS